MTILDPDGLWTKAQKFFSLLFSFMMLFVVGFLTLCLMDRTPPSSITQMYPSATRLHPGDEIEIHYFVMRHAVAEQKADPYLFDASGVRWEYPTTGFRVVNDDLGPDAFRVRKMIPAAATPGRARYRVVMYYRRPFNPIHWVWPVVVVPDDLEFEIVK